MLNSSLNLNLNQIYYGFQLIRQEEVIDIKCTAYIFKHLQSGAELLYLANDDDNKVCTITLKTLPTDSTGVGHILEHSVLAGSHKFPLKEPFADLVRGSLSTFINAFTFPDKTMYPFASKNTKNFRNVMDVYFDAVFNPLLKKETFLQEGWHYHLEKLEDEIEYKGVVYNEMKGCYSSSNEVLQELVKNSLFTGCTYAHDSGGAPKDIPSLTYDDFKKFHQKYYHPSNSKIFLYGDLDILDNLKFIDENYLSKYQLVDWNFEMDIKPIKKKIIKKEVYPIGAKESVEKKSFVVVSWLLEDIFDSELDLAFGILNKILKWLDNSPLKRVLLESGLGSDIVSVGLGDDLKKGVFSVGLKWTEPEKMVEIETLIEKTLQEIVQKGIDPKIIEAAINITEFSLREANFGAYPKGIIYSIVALKGWLFDQDPLKSLKYETDLKVIKKKAVQGYFEELITKYLLNNQQKSVVVLAPDQKIAQKNELAIKKELTDFKKSLTSIQLKNLVAETQNLLFLQNKVDTPKEVAILPKLNLKDINPQSEKIPHQILDFNENNKIVHTQVNTNGIVYLNLNFPLNDLPTEYYSYLSLFADVLTDLGTKQKSPLQLEQEILINTGGIGANITLGTHYQTRESVRYFSVSGKATIDKLPKLLALIGEVLTESNLANQVKIKEIISRIKVNAKLAIIEGGMRTVFGRLESYLNKNGQIKEQTNGLNYYYFIEDLEQNFEARFPQLLEVLTTIQQNLFVNKDIIYGLVIDQDNLIKVKNDLKILNKYLPKKKDETIFPKLVSNISFLTQENEWLVVASQINYVGLGANIKDLKIVRSGQFSVFKKMLDMDYLWNEVRVKGGAYGCYSEVNIINGSFKLVSYRDPNLTKTLECYTKIVDFIKNIELTPTELEKLIIGTIQRLDPVLTPIMKGERVLTDYLFGNNDERRQKHRQQVLTTKATDFQILLPIFEEVIKEGKICVLGSENVLEKNKELFDEVVQVFK